MIGLARRNYLVPIPRAADFEALNARLLADCRRRLGDRLRVRGDDWRTHREGSRRVPVPAAGALRCLRKKPAQASCCSGALSQQRLLGADGLWPPEVLVRGYVHQVVISCGARTRPMSGRTRLRPADYGRCNRRSAPSTRPPRWLDLPKSSPPCAAPGGPQGKPAARVCPGPAAAGERTCWARAGPGQHRPTRIWSIPAERMDGWPGHRIPLSSAHHVHILEMNGDNRLKQSKRRARASRPRIKPLRLCRLLMHL